MNHSLVITYLPFLEKVLTPNRLRHSMGVMDVMGELANVYALDQDTARLAGLLHDAAKDLSTGEQDRIVREANISFQYPCEQDYNLYLHGPVGAYFIQKELDIIDSVVLDAITRHTWVGDGDDFNSPYVWCLRFADILEPNRRWDNKARWIQQEEPNLRKAAYAGKLEEAAFLQARMLIGFFEENQMPVHPNYYHIYSILSRRLRMV